MTNSDTTKAIVGDSPTIVAKKPKPSLSVVMPVYNGADFIVSSLPPIMAMVQRGEILEVIVVDDGSTDASASMAQEFGARVVPSGGRKGPGGARNEAAKIANGDILWFIDADVVLHDNAAAQLLEGFRSPGVVAVFGSYDDAPAAPNFFSQYKNLVHHYYHHQAKEEAQTFWSGCGAVKRESFLSVDGFDVERFKHPSIEDIDLGHRLLSAGGRILLRRDVLSTHLKVWRLGNLLHTEIFRRAIPWSRLILTSSGMPGDLNVGVEERVRAVIAALFTLSLLAVVLGLIHVWFVAISLLAVLLANKDITLFFYRTKGAFFALGALLFHQVYYLYSSAAFAWVVLEQTVIKMSGRGSASAEL